MKQQSDGKMVIVPADQFIILLEKVENGECLLLDVRDPDEFYAERITGAKNVPVDDIRNKLDQLDRDTSLLIYCKAGKRSNRAYDQLIRMGFHDIVVLDGGIESLKAHSRKMI
ncbi:MAG: rhodanese-like domain-containing protein [Methanomassiliicoccales archaeon]|nr:rhodanese-like domain-containing protein [Methanomassiliicoccales archaeon]